MKKFMSLALALIMVLGLVACGGGGSTSAGTTSTPAGNASTGTTSTPKEVKNVINFGLGGAAETTDPHANNKENTMQTFQWVYESLVGVDSKTNALKPALAESWEVKNDGKDYVFKIRQGVKFHSGNPLTADDVVFSMTRAKSMSFMKNYTGAIDTVEKTGDLEVTFHLKSANNGFIYQLFNLKVVEKAVVEKEGDNFGNAATLAGTGPYMYESYDPNTLVVFKKFNDYWGECGNIETINCHIVTNSSTRVTALQTGELDFIAVPSANWDKIKTSGKYATWEGESTSTCCIIVNHYRENSPLNDIRVRQALRYAINVDAVIQVAAGGLGTPAEIMCNPNYIAGATVDDQLKNSFKYDPEKAKQLLADAGYANGVQLGIFLIPNKNDNEAVAQVLQNMWEQVGIKITLELAESSTASAQSKEGYQDVYITVSNMVLHMSDQKRGIHSSTFKTQVAKYGSAELDGYLDGGEAALTDADRDAMYLKANHWLDDMCVNVPLYYQNKVFAWDKALSTTITPTFLYIQEWNWT